MWRESSESTPPNWHRSLYAAGPILRVIRITTPFLESWFGEGGDGVEEGLLLRLSLARSMCDLHSRLGGRWRYY